QNSQKDPKLSLAKGKCTTRDVMGAGGVGWCLLGRDLPQRSLEADWRRRETYGGDTGAPPLISQRVYTHSM
ncbi:hypothetical protein ACQP3D_27260, partial [Escherichia coli]